jgi:hypothetical protein
MGSLPMRDGLPFAVIREGEEHGEAWFVLTESEYAAVKRSAKEPVRSPDDRLFVHSHSWRPDHPYTKGPLGGRLRLSRLGEGGGRL